MNLEQPQVMKCLLFYNAPINASNPRTNARKGLISYYKTNNIMSLKNHVDVDHHLISKKFEEVQNMMRGSVKRQLKEKHLNHINLFCCEGFIKKNDIFRRNLMNFVNSKK
jgi:hypothetical protein